MKLTVDNVTALFGVSEKTIYRWIKSNNLPAYRINNQYRFNYTELLEWASAHRINVAQPMALNNQNATTEETLSFSDALVSGGIHYRVGGIDKLSVLTEVVNLLRLPDRINRDVLLQILLAREEIGSTAIGDGIAIPHARNPIVLNVTQPYVALCFLENPIEFDALDGVPVHSLFTLITPTIKSHLRFLSQLAFFLKDANFHAAIIQHASREAILSEAKRVEMSFRSASDVTSQPSTESKS
ncbi:MAG: PTS sugar transporter subunit IIA [bacterium]|nr:PTS sugar transporter subunit IIA [bacterium]